MREQAQAGQRGQHPQARKGHSYLPGASRGSPAETFTPAKLQNREECWLLLPVPGTVTCGIVMGELGMFWGWGWPLSMGDTQKDEREPAASQEGRACSRLKSCMVSHPSCHTPVKPWACLSPAATPHPSQLPLAPTPPFTLTSCFFKKIKGQGSYSM